MFCLLFLALNLSGQTTLESAEHDRRPRFTAETNLVALDVTVTDKRGRPIEELTKEDFSVYEDKRKQEIVFFSHEQRPASWGLVLDRSGSMADMIAEVYRAALHSIEAGTPEDETFSITFSDYPTLIQGFTTDRQTLLKAINHLRAGGWTALYDAVALALDYIKGARHKKRVLVVVTDGGDNASVVSFSRLVNMARRSEILIYVVGFFGPMSGGFLGMEEARTRGRLKRLAEETGGMAYFPKTMEQCVSACKDIGLQVSRQYSLGYYPSYTINRGGRWQEIRVELRRGEGRVVRARKSYFAPARSEAGTARER